MDYLNQFLDGGKVVNFDEKVEVPLSPLTADDNQESTDCHQVVRLPLTGTKELSEDDVRRALLHHVDRLLFHGKKVAKEMFIIKMDYYSSYRYTLEILTETRSVGWTFDSYVGTEIDNPECGQSIDPWEIEIRSPESFESKINSSQVPIPHTEQIQVCHLCNGTGLVTCKVCRGRKRVTCKWCNGFSSSDGSSCMHCTYGDVRCDQCKATGIHRCDSCLGTGKIVAFVTLFVKWTKSCDNYLIEHPDVPRDMIKKASGALIINETSKNMKKIEYFQDANQEDVKQIYKQIYKSQSNESNGKPVFYRQKVIQIPIVRVDYSWKNHLGNFWVFGSERSVFTPNYPEKTSCTIN